MSDINQRIKEQLESTPYILYMKGSPDFPQCGFSAKVVQLLDTCDIDYAYVNILEEPELREALKVYSQWPTYPQLYVKGELVGGCDIITSLYEQGKLNDLFK